MRESIQYRLCKSALQGLTDNDTIKSYKRNIKQFASWAREEGYTADTIDKAAVQRYADSLDDRSLSASTIHTYIAPVCKGLSISMADIDKPVRSSVERSRRMDKNRRGHREAQMERYRRSVVFAEAVGIRRAELASLSSSCLQKDESGEWCVCVERGKGGKRQLQRILPQDLQVVKNVIRSADPTTDKLFKKDELSKNIDYHGMRAAHARSCYGYYKRLIDRDPGYRDQLKEQLYKRWQADGRPMPGAAFSHFKAEIERNETYYVRGANLSRATQNGRPVAYDRVALMAVSVFHLAHYRCDVTVKHYML